MSDMRLPRPTVREEFRKRLRADLLNEAVALAEERRLRRASLARRILSFTLIRLRPVAVAATLVAVLLAGTGAAAAGSLPGDPAFGLKRAAEEVELALAPSDDAKVRALAAQAERRLDELGRTTARPERAPTASAEYAAAVQRLASAVATLRAAQPGAAKREAVDQVVEAARDKHVQVLEELRQRLPEAAQQGIDRAIEQHERLSPAKPGERGPRESQRPGGAPRKSDEPEKSAAPGREAERPRASETPRGGRPSASPSPQR